MNLEARHVAVLLDPGEPREQKVEMPEHLGRWTKAPTFKRRKYPDVWRFELSEAGIMLAAEVKQLSDAANESMREYLNGEHANCFPGAFRDGFSRGVAWARRSTQ